MHWFLSLRCFVAGGLMVAAAASSAAPPPASRSPQETDLLAAPAADLITPEFLAPAARQALANGVATLVARITADGNDHGLAFPPTQTMKLVSSEEVKTPARRVRVQVEQPIYEHEYGEVERIVPVMESGQPTGRFTKEKVRVIVKSRQVGTRVIDVDNLTPDPAGSEVIVRHNHKYGPGGPAMWAVHLPGLNGMALYILAKAGLERHPATVKHAKALAAYAGDSLGLPDSTFDVAWMTAGFAALGSNSKHQPLVRRLVDKLIDGQVREKGPLDGLWGPVCVNYGYYGKLFMLGQTVRQELDIHIPKRLKTANPAQQAQLLAMGKEMKAVANAYEKTHRDVFRCGTQMLTIRSPYRFDEENWFPGLPLNAYQWVATDVESTALATFALAEANRAGLLPRETERLAIRGKKIHPPVKPEVALKAAAKRLADAIDADGGCSALAAVALNTGFEKTGFPAPAFADPEALPPLLDVQTAGTCLAADAATESLSTIGPDLAKELDAPRRRSRDRAMKIAARWYAESANSAADPWKGMYQAVTIPHADLKKSPVLPVPELPTGIDALPWGPTGSLYRLVALQDPNGQWSGSGHHLFSTACESLTINRVADSWHKSLSHDPPRSIGAADPVSYESMLQPRFIDWNHGAAAWPDPAVFPTLASLLFLLDASDGPVSLAGIKILPGDPSEPPKEDDANKPPPRLTPLDAVRRVARPNGARDELFAAIIATCWPRSSAAASIAPPAEPTVAEKTSADEPAEDDGLGKFEDLLNPSPAAE